MTNALGPVIGNRFADERKTQLKPHLLQRLDGEVERVTALGTVLTGEGGRMTFVPNYVHAGKKTAPKTQPAEGDDERACMTGFDPMTSPIQLGDRVRKVSGKNAGCMGTVTQQETCGKSFVAWESNPTGDDGWWTFSSRERWEIVSRGEAKPAFDPMTEPLQVGDEIEVVYAPCSFTGQRDIVVAVGASGETVCKDTRGWSMRSSLKLIRKADPARKPS